mmetsp:Transcript_30352/g.22123  ORF Transcript_30352/g.22123 Transcript_30352/m.22123 type:complete len:83 (+) Transcript_30352:273-521(+)
MEITAPEMMATNTSFVSNEDKKKEQRGPVVKQNKQYCQLCYVEFTLLVRKNHCDICGRSCCTNCSQKHEVKDADKEVDLNTS